MKKNVLMYLSGFVSAFLIFGLALPTLAANGTQLIEANFDPISIIVDGQFKNPSADMQPMIYNGRTYVALRYVGETFGKFVDWDGISRVITIESRGLSSTTTTPSTPITPVVTINPAVISAIPSKTSISPGENISVTVTTNGDTKTVKLMDDKLNLLAESGTYADMGSTRVFNISYTPAAGLSGNHRVTVYPTDGVVMNSPNAKEFILAIQENRQIHSIEASRTNASLNSNVTIKVYTNDAVTKVKLTNDYDSAAEENGSFSTSGSQRIFTFTVSSNRARSIKYTAYAGSSSGYDDSINKTVSISYGSSSTNSSDVKVTVSNSGSSKKQIAVVTYDDIERVEIQTSGGKVVATITASDYYSSGKVEWTTTINNSSLSSGTYYAYAYYDFNANDYVRTSFTVSGGSGSGNGYIYDYNMEYNTTNGKLPSGGKVTITFYTDYNLKTVRIYDPDGYEVRYDTNPKESSGYWTTTFRAYDSGTYELQVKDEDGYDKRQTFDITVN